LATGCLPERQVKTELAGLRMYSRFEGLNAVIKKPRFPAPNHHITVLKHEPFQRIVTA
jgi:hypothetical protein